VIAAPVGQTISGSGSTGVFAGLTAGATYTFTVVNTASCTSNVSSNAVIQPTLAVPAVPTYTFTQPTCPIPTGGIAVTAPLGAGLTYSINGINYQISPNFMGLAAGSYNVSVQNTSSGCITVNPIPVVINPVPQPPAISVAEVHNVTCFGANDGWAVGVVDSLGTPPFVYSWAPGSIANDTASNLAPGNYNFAVIDSANCLVVTGINITQPSALSIVGDSTPINCATGQLGTMDVTVAGGSGTYSYLWSPNGQTTDSIFNLNVGNYSVVVSDTNNCQISFFSSIGITNALPVNIVPGDTVINPSTSFMASVNPGNVYAWTPNVGLSCDDCPNPMVTPDTTTMYYVNVSDMNGCVGEDSMLVTVKLICGEYFVPTIFSPNGTGPDANNTLRVFGKETCIKDFSFVIYDRWGGKVFESVSINMAWDGFYKGRPAQEGNFVYDLNVQLYDDSIVRKSGSLTLVR
jgi:gliding motility-associated-like protein